MSRSKLLAHRWKRSFQLGAFSGDANANSLPTGKQMPICQYLFSIRREGDEVTSPSFAVENAGIDAFCVLLEPLIAT